MVEARAAQVTRLRRSQPSADYWAARARSYRAITGVAADDDALVQTLRPWLTPRTTLLDVGAGAGRYAIPLAPLVREVIAVEPSAAMLEGLRERARERGVENIRVVERRWEDARDLRADVVLCAHVLYPIADVVPFIRALAAAARERCVLALRAQSPETLLRDAWIAVHGEPPRHDPAFIEAFNLLWQLGFRPDVRIVPSELRLSFADREAALGWARDMLWLAEDPATDALVWPYLEPLLESRSDGTLGLRTAGLRSTVVWWDRV